MTQVSQNVASCDARLLDNPSRRLKEFYADLPRAKEKPSPKRIQKILLEHNSTWSVCVDVHYRILTAGYVHVWPTPSIRIAYLSDLLFLQGYRELLSIKVIPHLLKFAKERQADIALAEVPNTSMASLLRGCGFVRPVEAGKSGYYCYAFPNGSV